MTGYGRVGTVSIRSTIRISASAFANASASVRD